MVGCPRCFVGYDEEDWNGSKEGWPKWLVVLLTRCDVDYEGGDDKVGETN